jgi:membrane fusion protein, copper/silver efflux system
MNKKTKIIISIIIGLLVFSNGFMFYYFVFNKNKIQESTAKKELYVCPMHPQIQQDHPGTCPICNMELVLKSSNEDNTGNMNGEMPNKELGEIALSPTQQVLANVKTQTAQYGDFLNSIEANGVVKLRDDASRQISSPVKGKITKLYINYEGQKVIKGQKAFELYSPELIATQREFLLAYENYLQAQESPNLGIKESAQSVLNAAKQRLLLWFVDEKEINELMATRQVKNSLTYYSDFSGVVTKKYFNEGSWVMEGTTILDVVNLSSVWVMANIYENDINKIRTGQTAEITVTGEEKTIKGKIDYITPFVNTDTRTVEVRITAPNNNSALKPGTYVKTKIQTEKTYNSIVLPRTAVLRTGKMDMVYVKKSENIFAPKEVVVGGEKDGKIIIISGINTGDEVVVSAGFLIDSESQIQMGSGSNMEGMDMPEKKNDLEIKEGNALKDTKLHKH